MAAERSRSSADIEALAGQVQTAQSLALGDVRLTLKLTDE